MTPIADKMTNTAEYSGQEYLQVFVIFRFGFGDNGQFVI
jgi:hypothetical protein